MIPNLLNTLLGLWLAYVAIFPASIGEQRYRWLLAAAAVTAALAFWARRSDFSTWQSTATIISALALAVLLTVSWLWAASPDLMFWGVLWAGLISATFSLWAALYRPTTDGAGRLGKPLYSSASER
jgi:hypothetical protein